MFFCLIHIILSTFGYKVSQTYLDLTYLVLVSAISLRSLVTLWRLVLKNLDMRCDHCYEYVILSKPSSVDRGMLTHTHKYVNTYIYIYIYSYVYLNILTITLTLPLLSDRVHSSLLTCFSINF